MLPGICGVSLGQHAGQTVWTPHLPRPRLSIIDARLLLTRGRWLHNTSQVRLIFDIKAVQSQHTSLFEVWGTVNVELGTCVGLFTVPLTIWKEGHETAQRIHEMSR